MELTCTFWYCIRGPDNTFYISVFMAIANAWKPIFTYKYNFSSIQENQSYLFQQMLHSAKIICK